MDRKLLALVVHNKQELEGVHLEIGMGKGEQATLSESSSKEEQLHALFAGA